jgi:hypothetical protein
MTALLTTLIILGSAGALVTAVLMLRVGVFAAFGNGEWKFMLTLGGIRIPLGRIIRSKRGKNKKTEKSRKKVKKNEDNELNLPPIPELLAIIIETLDKLRQRITIQELDINFSVGGNPFSAAVTSGLINELVGSFAPIITSIVRIKRSEIIIAPAFLLTESVLLAEMRVTVPLGSLCRIALSAFTKYTKAQRKGEQNGKASTGRIDGSNDEKDTRNGRRKYHRGHTHSDA